MDGHGFPDTEQLLQFLKKLKEVFDVCDEDADGFIRVEHFVDLGLQFGQGEEVKKLTKYLDPHALGKITFKEFCHGVFAIKGCEEILKNALGARTLPCRQYDTDNGYYYQVHNRGGAASRPALRTQGYDWGLVSPAGPQGCGQRSWSSETWPGAGDPGGQV
ncbi:RFP4A protein, partial [Amia calva]|nr:RFP4A protein [Amia calva]